MHSNQSFFESFIYLKFSGFLPQNTDDYHRSIKQIASYDEWKNHRGKI